MPIKAITARANPIIGVTLMYAVVPLDKSNLSLDIGLTDSFNVPDPYAYLHWAGNIMKVRDHIEHRGQEPTLFMQSCR